MVEDRVLRYFVVGRRHWQVLVGGTLLLLLLGFVVDVGVGNEVQVLEFAPLCSLALQSQVSGVLVDRNAFDFAFALADAILTQVDDFLQIRIEHVDFLAVIVELVAVALAVVVRILGAPVRHKVKHGDLTVDLLDLGALDLEEIVRASALV